MTAQRMIWLAIFLAVPAVLLGSVPVAAWIVGLLASLSLSGSI